MLCLPLPCSKVAHIWGRSTHSVVDRQSILRRLTAAEPGHYQNTYISLVKECADTKSLEQGRNVHAHIVKTGYQHVRIIANLLINMYGRCHSIEDAVRVFSTLPDRNAFSWISLVSAYAQNGYMQQAEEAFQRMPCHTIAAWNSMITAFGQGGCVSQAIQVFHSMPCRETVSWNSMIISYAKNGYAEQAYELFQRMVLEGEQPNRVTLLGMIDTCGKLGWLREAELMHSEVGSLGWQSDVFLGTAVVTMYGRCCEPDKARDVFESIPEKNPVSWTSMVVAYSQNGRVQEARTIFNQAPVRTVVSWSAMVAAYAQNGHPQQALLLFQLMDMEGFPPSTFTFTSAIDACATSESLSYGRLLHSEAESSGFTSHVHVGGALVNMYGRCGQCSEAKHVYDGLPEKNEVVTTALICAYSEACRFPEGLHVFRCMDLEGFKSTSITYVSVLDACDNIQQGKILHERIKACGLELHSIVTTALTCMYRRCGSTRDARSVFDKLLYRNVVNWTAMIVGHVENGQEREALELFKKMDIEGTRADNVILTSVIDACANLPDLIEGRAVHRGMEDGDYPVGEVGTGLIDMYGKCGSVVDAKLVFDNLVNPDVMNWTSMVTVYAQNGKGVEAVELFRTMELEGTDANEVALVSVLNACSHFGMIKQGIDYFFSIREDRKLVLLPEHYVCLVDLLSRLGELRMAENVIDVCLSMESDRVVAWTAMLGACKIHGDQRMAEHVAEKLIELNPELSSSYILLSCVHSDQGLEKLVKRSIRTSRRHVGSR